VASITSRKNGVISKSDYGQETKPQLLRRLIETDMERTQKNKHKGAPRKASNRQLGDFLKWQQYVDAFQLYAHPQDHINSISLTYSIEPSTTSQPESSAFESDFYCSHLYALDVDDLRDFSLAEIFVAWELRAKTCGSLEAAAEMYALYRVGSGEDETYAGPSVYLDHPLVQAIFTQVLLRDERVADELEGIQLGSSKEQVHPPEAEDHPGLSLCDVRMLSPTKLKTSWSKRPESYASLEAAAEALAKLRSITLGEEKVSFLRLLQHPLIRELEDSLPSELERTTPVSSATELELFRADRRAVRPQTAVIRSGQGNFRLAMLSRYGFACCVTGCTVETLLEAAHIIPYRGDHSDDELNGLLLRVDIHRLFDAYLISVNPRTYTVEVANALDDEFYKRLHGKQLFGFTPKPRVLFLEAHYQKFSSLRDSPK
jgi:hypothetical protein